MAPTAESWLEVAVRIVAEHWARVDAYRARWHPAPERPAAVDGAAEPVRRMARRPWPSLDDGNQGERLVYLMPGGRCVTWDGQRWAAVPAGDGETDGAERVPASTEWLRLRCAPGGGGRATKRFERTAGEWTAEQEAPGRWFLAEVVHVDETAAAWRDFFAAQADDSGAFLVRAVLARAPEWVVRRAKVAEKGAWLGPHPTGRRVVVLDFDKLDAAALLASWPGATRWPTVAEGAALVRASLRQLLPGRFGDAAAAYRWSASTGVPGGKRGPHGWTRPSCHVALVLDAPVYDDSLAKWLREVVPAADASVAEAVHPLFLAAPFFADGSTPWPADFPRVGLLDGHAVTRKPAELLDGETWQAAEDAKAEAQAREALEAVQRAKVREAYRATREAWGDGWSEREADRPRRFAEELIRGATDEIRGAGVGQRHATMRAKTMHLGRFVAGSVVDAGRYRAELRAAWQAVVPRERWGEGDELIESGLRLTAGTPTTWEDVQNDSERREAARR